MIQVSQAPKPSMSLLHLYADDHGDTHFGTTEIALPASGLRATGDTIQRLGRSARDAVCDYHAPRGLGRGPHRSPKPQVLFCLTGSIKITCSTGDAAVIDAGVGVVMTDVSGKGHKSEVTSAEPVSASSFNSAENHIQCPLMGHLPQVCRGHRHGECSTILCRAGLLPGTEKRCHFRTHAPQQSWFLASRLVTAMSSARKPGRG